MSRTQRSHRARIELRRRRSLAILSCLVLAVAAALLPSGPARAATNPFNIDGSVPDAGTVQLNDPFGAVKELGPKNGTSTKIGVIHTAAPPMLDTTNPNGQVDLRRAWLDLKRDSDNNDWVYFAWERDANTGSGFIAFEFMKSGVPAACNGYNNTEAQLIASCNPWKDRQAGDFLILWDQQGSSTTLYKRVWQQSGSNLVLGASQTIVNGEAKFSSDGFKGEAAVNITAEGLSTAGACVSFANVIPSTVTGNSDQADYKDTILQVLPPISNCTATIVTTPKDGSGAAIPAGGLSIGTGVTSVKDSATISLAGGSATPSGSVSFFLCQQASGTCTTGGTSVGSVSIAGGTFPKTVSSPTAYVTSAGRYCWRAEWPGDAANGIPATSDSAATECFTVNPVTPTLSTTAGADVVLGNAVTDSAALGGTATRPATPVINLTGTAGPAADGTITFKLYGPSDTGCGALVFTSSTVPVSGNGTYNAPSFTPTAPGNYHWVAVYSGSSPNTSAVTHNAACTDTDEDVTVSDVPSSISTAQRWVPNDSATVSAPAGGNLSGTVHFALYANGTCSGSAIYTEDKAVSGSSPRTVSTSNTTAQDATGTFSWGVSYDSDNPAQRDIPASCQETSSLTVANGSSVSSP